jgi:dipeptidyl aminopeptidase/acylaminoacyl peptidase
VAPYGSWRSPITAELIVGGTVGLGQIALDGDNVYWSELRPTEGGRYVVVCRTPDGRTEAVTAAPFNVRTRVHEYGGGAFCVDRGTLCFSNFADQRLYRWAPGSEPRALTPPLPLRYADLVVDRARGRLLAVREDHRAGAHEPVNTLVALPLDGEHEGQVLVAGADFYAAPRLSPDGSQLAWLSWNHPDMPWDRTDLWVAPVEADGTLGPAVHAAGGPTESIFQPEWGADSSLYFVSDRTGWWNLTRWRGPAGSVEPLLPLAAEFGEPQWLFGMATYAFAGDDRIVASCNRQGSWGLLSLDLRTRQAEPIETLCTVISSLRAAPGRAVFAGGSPTESLAILQLDLATGKFEVLRRSSSVNVDPGYLSVPEAIEFPTEGEQTAHAFFYPPRSRDYAAPPGERPPLLVKSHGGPTGAATSGLSLGIQYWTSRGIAVLDVNYGGSSGYGRAYRERLNGQWGIVDVDDCANGARWLAAQGRVDPRRMAITGGSAGGYTTLCALTFRDAFGAGASHFGVSDLEALARDTHKFESRYLDRLVGPYPEREDLYRARSPIHFTERLSCPVIFFQGLEDAVVPPDQAERMVAALRAKGLPVAYVPFAGEQHGFRRAENIRRALDGELYFYARVFGFQLADPVAPVPIENLPE